MKLHSSFLTSRFDQALQLASELHHRQRRKGTSIPYIAHLLGVCALVLEAGGDEDQAVAALVHDAVEDQGGLATLETIRRSFGDRVGGTVLLSANQDVLLVATADKLHNARAILSDHRQVGDEVFKRFTAPKDYQLW